MLEASSLQNNEDMHEDALLLETSSLQNNEDMHEDAFLYQLTLNSPAGPAIVMFSTIIFMNCKIHVFYS